MRSEKLQQEMKNEWENPKRMDQEVWNRYSEQGPGQYKRKGLGKDRIARKREGSCSDFFSFFFFDFDFFSE